MSQQTTPSSGASGQSSPRDIFMLTDEQILEIAPEPQNVEISAAGSGAQPGSAESAPSTTPTNSTVETAAAPFAKPDDVRALAELYPGGLAQAKSAAERARTLDEMDAAYFGGAGHSPEQISAARAQLAQRLLREEPAAFREMVFAGLRALEQQGTGPVSGVADATGRIGGSLSLPPHVPASVGATLGSPSGSGAEGGASPAPTTSGARADSGHGVTHSPHEAHLAAYTEFEKAANADLEKSVGGAIDRALHQALPNLGRGDESAPAGAQHSAPLQARLGAAIREDVEKALQSDRQLGEQVAQILSARRFDNETRAQVVRLINDRAQQLVPGAAKRALNDWTQATLATHRASTRHSDSNASRVDLSPATSPGSADPSASAHSAANARSENARAAHASKSTRVDYRKLSDDQILDL